MVDDLCAECRRRQAAADLGGLAFCRSCVEAALDEAGPFDEEPVIGTFSLTDKGWRRWGLTRFVPSADEIARLEAWRVTQLALTAARKAARQR